MPSSHLILCCPLLLLPLIPPSNRVFFPVSQLFAWGGQSTGVSASTSVLPKNTQDRSISFRMDWLDLVAVQGTLKSLLQHHSSKTSILWHSAFFTVQLSHAYMTTGKTIALTRRTFVGKVMSLLFNRLRLNKILGYKGQWRNSSNGFVGIKVHIYTYLFHGSITSASQIIILTIILWGSC